MDDRQPFHHDLVEVLVDPLPRAEVLVVSLDPWIDAGFGASQARTALVALPSRVVGRFDADALVDHQARRPVVRIVEGVHDAIAWPVIELHEVTDTAGRTFLHLRGPEPDHRWRAVTVAVVGLCAAAGVRSVLSLGAYPAPMPHTRAARVVASASSREIAERVGIVPGQLDVPAGINAAIEVACSGAGLETVSLWAQVPHYVANLPYPAAALALLGQVHDLAGITVDTGELATAAADTHRRITELVASNDEHLDMVRQLETAYDEVVPPPTVPSGDEIAAELERFLRSEDR
ncbi:MAG: PAC2 family protein [Actinobacteria bacterium]|nr:PAC2 family protein [Actinomycetota bacterium]